MRFIQISSRKDSSSLYLPPGRDNIAGRQPQQRGFPNAVIPYKGDLVPPVDSKMKVFEQ